jgi:hypothetical protein
VEDDFVVVSNMLLGTVLAVVDLITTPNSVIDSMKLLCLGEPHALQRMPVRLVSVEIEAFLAQVILAVSAMINNIIGLSPLYVLLFSPSAASVVGSTFAVDPRSMAAGSFFEFSQCLPLERMSVELKDKLIRS